MTSLDKSLRNQLERTVKDARDVAEAAARSTIDHLGVGEASAPAHLSPEERELRKRLRIHGHQLGDSRDSKSTNPAIGTQETDRLVEEVAYEHWHRMLFARFLAENNLLMYPDPSEPVAVSIQECDDLAADEKARNGWELAARFAARMLPDIFRPDSPVFKLDLPPESQQRLERLLVELPGDVFKASDSLGWVYQFWQAKRKDEVNASEVKIGARELPAVTQLFTEDYMVDFLLDNTLGAWWAGKLLAANPKRTEAATNEDELRTAVALPGVPWKYLRFIKGSGGTWMPAAGSFDGWPKTANRLKCLDPCMGSGHFVVAMFERLVALRMAGEDLDEKSAVAAVIRDNLFGLEIDLRCTQIAAFNLALAAWRRVGHCGLPSMNMACSGLAPNASEEDWLAIGGDNEKLQNGMERLHRLFQKAAVLGSLINPRAGEGDLLVAAFHELQPLLEKALAQETKDDTAHELAVTARGLAKAAEILAGQFTLVATNVPYLGRGKQDDELKDFCERVHPEGKADLATCFVERCLEICSQGASMALVTPQNWLFLGTYKKLRARMLEVAQWDFVARLGERGFESTQAAGAFTTMVSITRQKAPKSHSFAGLDVAQQETPSEKSLALSAQEVVITSQTSQLGNPDSRITLGEVSDLPLLQEWAESLVGIQTGDYPRFVCCFWEFASVSSDWDFYSRPSDDSTSPLQKAEVILWEKGNGSLLRFVQEKLGVGGEGAWLRGEPCWGKRGVAVQLMRELNASHYDGQKFDQTLAVILPKLARDLPAIWAFVASPDFTKSVRTIDQKLNLTNSTLGKVPFDLAHWQKVAAEKYPHGLPKPFSSDPTQWLFNGNPAGADQPLHVAVARLLGYQWPRQTESCFPDCPAIGPDGLESLADRDGLVCIPAVRGEASAADRLLNLLAKAYGSAWSTDTLNRLLKEAGYAGKTLETWMRDGFFAQHCDMFHQRPFIWQIWDGLRDGFSILVNYHRLDRKNLETLIYNYLGDWIARQKQDQAARVDGAEERLAAAMALQKKLELIRDGESPYDIFVRWKPLDQQPIGWEPDPNDGVRLNIRPFLSVPDVKAKGAGVLRGKPKIKWEKDRGKEPQRPKDEFPWFWGWDGSADFRGGSEFTGERFNDCHYTIAFKQAARGRKNSNP